MATRRISLRLILVLLSVLLTTSVASAAGRVVWKKSKINESNDSWRIDLEMHMRRAPDFAHVPMKFKFTPLTYFERALVDGQEEPQLRRVPLRGKAPLIETVDVGFMDPGTGKIQKRTRFTFKITRARGFEAGEYKVKISNKRTGASVGTTKRITLDGENKVINRRSITFETKKKKKKKDESAESSEPEYDPTKDPSNDAFWEGGPEQSEEAPNDPLPPPAHLQEKPGGCGCRVVGADGGSTSWSWAWLFGLLGLAAWSGRGIRR